MKLGEAKRELTQIERRLREYVTVLSKGPITGVVAALNECNTLLHNKQLLEKAVSETEAVTELQGNPLNSVQSAYQTIVRRMDYLSLLIDRDDLDSKLKDSLFEQLTIFKDSRDNLEKGLEVCLWETELLE